LSSFNKASNITYSSNATTNLGAGVTYRNLSANVSAGLGFLNNGIEKRGRQLHWIFNFISFFKTGYLICFFFIIKASRLLPEVIHTSLPGIIITGLIYS